MERNVQALVQGSRAVDGAGVRLVRVLGRDTIKAFDPFLMLDAFDSTNPNDYTKGFPWHPHRGIETVTYLIKGNILHEDSLGNKGDIVNGCCQWMTAGSGILHQEMPQASPRMLGLQLWLNLPASAKMAMPMYHDIRTEQVPEVTQSGAVVRVIAGHFGGVAGAAQGDHVAMTMLDVHLDPDAAFYLDTPRDETAFAYLFSGDGSFGGERQKVSEKTAALFTPGERLSVAAGEKGLRMVLCVARPLRESVAWGGPIVMNTREELQLAFDELDRGTFIKT